jgi:hypothetical protein
VRAPSVSDGHVAGWVGVVGDGGWLQAGLITDSGRANHTSKLYYEAAVPGGSIEYAELDPSVEPGEAHRVSVLELSGRKAWWRVWVDNRPASPRIHLPGSHAAWYPQAVGENQAGGTGTCNGYSYRFTEVTLAHASGGKWKPLTDGYLFQDDGYRTVQTSVTARSFVATSV